MKVLFGFQEKQSSPVPVMFSASLSWDPSLSAGAHPVATLASWWLVPVFSKEKNKSSTGWVLQGQSTKSITEEATTLLSHTHTHTHRGHKYIYAKQFIHHPNAKPRGNTQEPAARASEETCNAVLYLHPRSLLMSSTSSRTAKSIWGHCLIRELDISIWFLKTVAELCFCSLSPDITDWRSNQKDILPMYD